MLPTPVVTANAPLMVDINKKSISEIKIAFMSCLLYTSDAADE